MSGKNARAYPDLEVGQTWTRTFCLNRTILEVDHLAGMIRYKFEDGEEAVCQFRSFHTWLRGRKGWKSRARLLA